MKMKTMMWVLALALTLCMAAGALAETVGVGPAVLCAQEQGGFVDMRAAADEGSALLMCYFDGTVCDVREIAGDWARVRVGSETIYLQGYVRTDSLRGVEIMRERGRSQGRVDYLGTGVPYVVYAACDAHAKELAREQESGISERVCGTNGEWAQITNGCVARDGWLGVDAGFIQLEGLRVEQVSWPDEDALPYNVHPTAEEMSYEEAYERGIALMAENADFLFNLDEDERDEASLRQMAWDLRLTYNPNTGETQWEFTVQDSVEPGVEPKTMTLYMDAAGKPKNIEGSNG